MNLINLAEENIKQFGEYPYLVFGKKTYTNMELLVSAKKMAAGLKKLGLNPSDNVVVMLPNTPEVLISYQGILRAGCVIVPVVAELADKELIHILKNSSARAIVTSRELLPKIEAATKELSTLKHVILIEKESVPKTVNFWSLVNGSTEEPVFNTVKEGDLAVIIYTSGTTGIPKGVMLTHKNLYSNAINAAVVKNLGRSSINLAVLPLSHSFGITTMNTSYIYGNLFVLMPRFDVEEVFRLIQEYRITNITGVPAMFGLMLLAPPEVRKKYDLSSLKDITSGSAPLPLETLQAFEKVFGCVIKEGYGLSEASPVISAVYHDRENKPGSVGQLIPGIKIRIIDEKGIEVPAGEAGELIVKGPNISPGYYNMPEETGKAFENGWLHTGDIFKIDAEGYLYMVERKKDLIIRGGFNIYPRDVEDVLCQHPAVQEAVVIGVPDPIMGEEIKAFIVPANGTATNTQEIISFCQQHLAKNKCPSMIQFMDNLPKNAIGKVLRKELRQYQI